MAKLVRYDAVLRLRLTSELFRFVKQYAASYDMDMSQLIRDYIGKLEMNARQENMLSGYGNMT